MTAELCICGEPLRPLYANIGGGRVKYKRVPLGYCFSCKKARPRKRYIKIDNEFSRKRKVKSIFAK